MARPRLLNRLIRFYINLTLREGEDDDLIIFLSQVPARQRVRAIKRALRTGNLSTIVEHDGGDEQLADAFEELFL